MGNGSRLERTGGPFHIVTATNVCQYIEVIMKKKILLINLHRQRLDHPLSFSFATLKIHVLSRDVLLYDGYLRTRFLFPTRSASDKGLMG
jgi:hypothetical protein